MAGDMEKEKSSLTQDNSAIVRRFVEEVINRGQMDSAAQFVWEDVVEQVPLPGQGPGLEGLKDILRGMRSAFPDLDFSIEEQITEGDKWQAASNGPAPIERRFWECPQPGARYAFGA